MFHICIFVCVCRCISKNGFVQLFYDRSFFCRAFQMLPGEPNLNLIQTWKWHDRLYFTAGMQNIILKHTCDRLPSKSTVSLALVPQPVMSSTELCIWTVSKRVSVTLSSLGWSWKSSLCQSKHGGGLRTKSWEPEAVWKWVKNGFPQGGVTQRISARHCLRLYGLRKRWDHWRSPWGFLVKFSPISNWSFPKQKGLTFWKRKSWGWFLSSMISKFLTKK